VVNGNVFTGPQFLPHYFENIPTGEFTQKGKENSDVHYFHKSVQLRVFKIQCLLNNTNLKELVKNVKQSNYKKGLLFILSQASTHFCTFYITWI
jgi:hypothetical protein